MKQKKRITILIVVIILASSAYYFYFFTKEGNFHGLFKSEKNYSEKNILESKGANETTAPPEESLVEEKINSDNLSESQNKNAEVKKEIPAQPVVVAKIKCSLKVKEGSKGKLAKVSWNCENYPNWSCKLRNNGKTLIDSVKLPSDIQEVKAVTADLRRDQPCRSVTTPYYHWDCPPMTTHPGYNDYSLKCTSIEGKIENFHKLYMNYNY